MDAAATDSAGSAGQGAPAASRDHVLPACARLTLGGLTVTSSDTATFYPHAGGSPMAADTIACPHCGGRIQVSKLLTQQIRTELEQELASRIKAEESRLK
jgi:DNA-directed RNA polymerase subunit RPC12/RpoP